MILEGTWSQVCLLTYKEENVQLLLYLYTAHGLLAVNGIRVKLIFSKVVITSELYPWYFCKWEYLERWLTPQKTKAPLMKMYIFNLTKPWEITILNDDDQLYWIALNRLFELSVLKIFLFSLHLFQLMFVCHFKQKCSFRMSSLCSSVWGWFLEFSPGSWWPWGPSLSCSQSYMLCLGKCSFFD